jgi:anti-sigma28 factor (negative regulator of flagellin synthesis)
MHWHNPVCLRGPVSRTRTCWKRANTTKKRTMDHRTPRKNQPRTDIRVELVERIRREIAAGTYETPEKWQAALDRLMDRLEEE